MARSDIGPDRETYTGTPEEQRLLAEIAACQARLGRLERDGMLDAPAMLDDEARLARLREQLAAITTKGRSTC